MSTDFMPENLKDALRQLRAALGGLTQERFARKLGITVRTAARWEASEKLSPQILSRLRSIALGVSALELADWFGDQLQEALDLGPDETLIAEPAPGTPEEHDLIAEFLRRYRDEDPALRPFVEQLWEWIGAVEIEREGPRAPDRVFRKRSPFQKRFAEMLSEKEAENKESTLPSRLKAAVQKLKGENK
jgi:transcriptional regulator with XRE-family HTH domain